MTFEVEIGGRPRRVAVERGGHGVDMFCVTVDGRAHRVEARRIDDFTLSLLVERGTATVRSSQNLQPSPPDVAETDHRERVAVPLSRDVIVASGPGRGEWLVTVGGLTVVAIVDGRRAGRTSADAGRRADGEQPVVAPMPGRVVRVLVQPGDDVAVRQGLVVVEAMKMENELRAPKAGRVKDVQVAAGTSVEAGRVLVVIE